MVAAITRLMKKRCFTTCGALAMAASVAALSPSVWTKQMLSGLASWTAGAPGFSASSAVNTAGTGSYSTSMSSSASSACSRVSATTNATKSPTQRTRSPVRPGSGGA